MEDDAPLHANGAARAAELARVLADVSIDAIYTTQWIRTRDTAAPLAKARGIEPIVVNTSKTYAADLAKAIREKHRGQTVLVVGHSNSTSNVMRELGVENPPHIDESRYDDLFVCTIAGGKTRMLPLRYGAPVR
jgi:broad specificity phosphatase PhoE